MNIRLRTSRAAFQVTGLLLMFLAVPCVLTWRAWRQEMLNHELFVALSINDLHAAEIVLSEGADANARLAPAALNIWERFVNTFGWHSSSVGTDAPASLMLVFTVASTPFQDISGKYHFPPEPKAMVQLLLQKGAKPIGKYPDGSTLLLMPVAHEWTECVRLMLAAGADPNATDQYGSPVLRTALLLRDTKTVEVLMEKRANIHWKDAAGNTPLRIATILHDNKTVRLLQKAEAKE